MSALDRLIGLLAAQYRWGLHPLKVLVALLAPLVILWVADRWLRVRAGAIAEDEARLRALPRIRRR